MNVSLKAIFRRMTFSRKDAFSTGRDDKLTAFISEWTLESKSSLLSEQDGRMNGNATLNRFVWVNIS